MRESLNTREMGNLARRLGHSAGMADGMTATLTTTTFRVPYYWVPRARAEKILVNLMLRRYAAGEKGDYLSTMDNTTELSDILGTKYPSHFYKEIEVCSSCFKVYKLIDEARDRAMDKLHAKMDRKREKRFMDSREASGTPLVQAWSVQDFANSSADYVVDGSRTSSFPDAQTEGLARAEAAMACLTKSDVSELRSFKQPPHAVVMVTKALMLLLTGKAMPWKAAKKVMASGDRFLQMMAATMRDRNDLPPSRMDALRQYTSNPNFHPDCVEPISRSAARLCAWVLGVVQANGWATGTAHPRVDPLRPYSAPDSAEGAAAAPRPDFATDGLPQNRHSFAALPPVHESKSIIEAYANRVLGSSDVAHFIDEESTADGTSSSSDFHADLSMDIDAGGSALDFQNDEC